MIAVCIAGTTDYEFLRQWEYALSNFKPGQIFVHGTITQEGYVFRESIRVHDTSELPDYPLIVMAPTNGENIKGTESLRDFVHPPDATYFFGSDSRHLTEDVFVRKPDHLVYVPTDTTDQMFSWAAYVVTMYDRRIKSWLS